MEKYSRGVSRSFTNNILSVFFQNNEVEGALELVISLDQRAVNIKGLSSYLELIYRLDGILSNFSFYQYSHIPQVQIEIDEVRFGSWEIVLKELFDSGRAEKLVLIGLFLKYLPKVVGSFMDVALKYVEYRSNNEDYLEKKERREFRKSIRDAIADDEQLNAIDKKTKEQLINILDDLYLKNKNHIPASNRFAEKSVKAISIGKKDRRKNS